MFFKKKREGEFLDYSNKIRSFFEKGNYDSALARYSKFNYLYSKLSRDKKQEYEIEFKNLLNQLLMYVKIEELKVLVKGDDIDLIKESLNYLDFLRNTTFEIDSKYFGFVNGKYDEYFKLFNLKLASIDLDKDLEQIYKLRDEQNYEAALNLFPKLMKKYKELEIYSEDSTEVYNKLIDLREELKMSVLESRAYGEVAKVDLRSLKKAVRKKDVESAKKLHEKVFS